MIREIVAQMGGVRAFAEAFNRGLPEQDRVSWRTIESWLYKRDRELPGRAVISRIVEACREHGLDVTADDVVEIDPLKRRKRRCRR